MDSTQCQAESSLFTELDKVYKALGGACFCQAAFVHGHKLNFLSNVGDVYESGLIELSRFQSLAATLISVHPMSSFCLEAENISAEQAKRFAAPGIDSSC